MKVNSKSLLIIKKNLMKKIFFFLKFSFIFYFIFLFFSHPKFSFADTAQVNYQCQYYKELYNIISKNGSASEVAQARNLVDRYCFTNQNNQKGEQGQSSNNLSFLSCPYVYKPSCKDGKEPLSVRDKKTGCVISYHCLEPDKTFRNSSSTCPTPKPITCLGNSIKKAVYDNRGCLVRYYCAKNIKSVQNNSISNSEFDYYFVDKNNRLYHWLNNKWYKVSALPVGKRLQRTILNDRGTYYVYYK